MKTLAQAAQSENSMGVYECRFLRILDDRCKVIFAKYLNGVFTFSKLCSVLSDESLKKKFLDLSELAI